MTGGRRPRIRRRRHAGHIAVSRSGILNEGLTCSFNVLARRLGIAASSLASPRRAKAGHTAQHPGKTGGHRGEDFLLLAREHAGHTGCIQAS
jgi:hypothetical protein